MKLQGHGLIVRYGARAVLDGVDVTLRGGELVGLIGPNGAGKTTLLRALAGLRQVESGFVTCDDRAIVDLTPDARARNIAYLAQGGEVHWPMRVEAVIALGRLPHRYAQSANEAAIERAMDAAGVTAFRDRPMDTLSGGERMRVLLARALAVESALLLADEPVAALDPLHQLRVMALLRDTARAGIGVMAVLHDLSLAARFCDRLVLIAEGKVVTEGSPAEVLQPLYLKRAYSVEMVSGSMDGIPYVMPRSESPDG